MRSGSCPPPSAVEPTKSAKSRVATFRSVVGGDGATGAPHAGQKLAASGNVARQDWQTLMDLHCGAREDGLEREQPRTPSTAAVVAGVIRRKDPQLPWSGRGDLNPRPPRPERDSAQRCYLRVHDEEAQRPVISFFPLVRVYLTGSRSFSLLRGRNGDAFSGPLHGLCRSGVPPEENRDCAGGSGSGGARVLHKDLA